MASHQIWPRPSILPPPSIIKLVTWENSIQSSKSALPHALMLLGATSMPCSCLGDLHGPVKEIGFSRNSLPAGTMRVGKSPVAPQKSVHAFVNAYAISSKKVISGIEPAVKSMKVGGIRRIVIPPSQGYQNTSQEPLPPNFFDRQRLFTTIFNRTRLANGEGSTLGTLIFDIELIELVSLRN
ncbi:Peptidyl-prolyl cis-trans isomerase FKBP17-1, chloroplastic [Linum perenne]